MVFPHKQPSQQQQAQPPVGRGRSGRSPPAGRGRRPPGSRLPASLSAGASEIKSGPWCVRAGGVTGPAGSTGDGHNGTSPRLGGLPPRCLTVTACLFVPASNENPGDQPASEGCFAGLSVREINLLKGSCPPRLLLAKSLSSRCCRPSLAWHRGTRAAPSPDPPITGAPARPRAGSSALAPLAQGRAHAHRYPEAQRLQAMGSKKTEIAIRQPPPVSSWGR